MTICDTYGKLRRRMVAVCGQKVRTATKNARAVPGSQDLYGLLFYCCGHIYEGTKQIQIKENDNEVNGSGQI